MKGNFFSLKYRLQLFQDWTDDNLMNPYCARHHAGVQEEQDSISTFKSLLDLKVVDYFRLCLLSLLEYLAERGRVQYKCPVRTPC